MSEPIDGQRMTVTVVMDVQVQYTRGERDGPFRAGWDTVERFQAIGLEAAERAIAKAAADWAMDDTPDPDLAWDEGKVSRG